MGTISPCRVLAATLLLGAAFAFSAETALGRVPGDAGPATGNYAVKFKTRYYTPSDKAGAPAWADRLQNESGVGTLELIDSDAGFASALTGTLTIFDEPENDVIPVTGHRRGLSIVLEPAGMMTEKGELNFVVYGRVSIDKKTNLVKTLKVSGAELDADFPDPSFDFIQLSGKRLTVQ